MFWQEEREEAEEEEGAVWALQQEELVLTFSRRVEKVSDVEEEGKDSQGEEDSLVEDIHRESWRLVGSHLVVDSRLEEDMHHTSSSLHPEELLALTGDFFSGRSSCLEEQ